MSKGFGNSGGSKYSGSAADRQKQAQRAQLEQFKKFQEAVKAPVQEIVQPENIKDAVPKRDINNYLKALSSIPLSLIGQNEKFYPSEVYKKLSELTLESINENSRRAVLCWPNCDPSPAGITALLAIADCAATTPIEIERHNALTAPTGIRVLIYPYARTAHTPLRHIYVDKNYLGELQLKHQVRGIVTNDDESLRDYHKTLARVKQLTGRAKSDGKEYAEFKNPCLDEIISSGSCEGKKASNELLWRIGTKTDLSEISRTNSADDPQQSKFYMFGLRDNESLKLLRKVPKHLDIVFLDLDRTGRNRLGKEWFKRLQEFLRELNDRFGEIPIIALTDDPWTYDKIRFECFAPAATKKSKKRPGPASVIFAQKPEMLEKEAPIAQTYTNVKKFDVIAYGGDIAYLLEKLKSARTEAAAQGDIDNAERFLNIIGVISRCGSLPGSQAQLSSFIQKELGSNAAAELMAAYRVGGIISELRSSHGAYAQTNRAEMINLCSEVEAIWQKTEILTPMAPLLREIVEENFMMASYRAVIVLPKDMLADFAIDVLTTDPVIGEKVKSRIENGMLQLIDQAGLNDLSDLPSTKRNSIKTVVFVAPARSTVMSLLARPWLPETVIVLSDSETIQSSARDVARISTYPELIQLKTRMEGFVSSARAGVERVNNSRFNLDLSIEPSDDIVYPTGTVVNLAGNPRVNQTIIKIGLEGKQTLYARPGTKIVIQDTSHAIPLFSEIEAKDIDVGHRICVIGEAFVEVARPLLNITARAAEEIRDYHHEVLEKFSKLDGKNTAEKLISLVKKMNLGDVTEERARYWVTLDQQLQVPIHDVIPHAPRDWPTFKSFMNALSFGELISKRYWTWAVIAQRSHKMTAAINFHDAYRSILVDSYGAQSSHPDKARDVIKLRAAAEDFISTVEFVREEMSENVRT
jgi:hypothetical protein